MRESGYIASLMRWRQKTRPQWRWKNIIAHLMTSSTYCQKQWNEHGFGMPVVEDVRHQEWEYRNNEIVQGATYPNIEAIKDAVKLWAVSLNREFRVVKSGRKEYEVKCVNDGCP